MPFPHPTRRSFLTASTATMAAATLVGLPTAACTLAASPNAPQPTTAADPNRDQGVENMLSYCLNMSTINGGEVPIREQIKLAAKAGYDSVELWLRDVDKFVSEGGKLADLRNELVDLGLRVDSAIAFGKWIVDDEAERTAGVEQMQRDMETLRAIGGLRIAAPPVGATNEAGLNLDAAAKRYNTILELGRKHEVLPQVELWGFSKNLSTLAEVLYVAAAANHPDACVLLDVYHMYKGGSDFNNIGLVPAAKMHCLHMNDYPATPPRDQIADADRVYPGDGVAPLDHILQSLVAGGFRGTLSLELFNRTYWQQPAQEVATLGLAKMKAAVAKALG